MFAVDDTGMAWVDCPLSGGMPGALSGKLTIMAGGGEEDFERAREVMQHLSANYNLMGGQEGFPAWQGSTNVYHGGPDDTGALASYIANHSPVHAPKGDRVTLR